MGYSAHAAKLDLVPCRRCGAKQGKPCRGPNGALTSAHVCRNPWVPSNDDEWAGYLATPAPEEHW